MGYVFLFIRLFTGFGAISVAHCLLKFVCMMDASLIARKLIDVRVLIAIIEARDEIRYEATSTSLESKKKKMCKLEKPRINNEDIEKILVQLVGAVSEIGYLLKCLIVVLVSFWSCSCSEELLYNFV